MEAELSVVCDCGSHSVQQVFLRFLQDETRPILEEDVVKEERQIFTVLDECPAVDWCAVRGDRLLDCYWFIGGDNDIVEAEQILKDLYRAGAQKAIGALWLDGAFNGLVSLDGSRSLTEVSGYDRAELRRCIKEESSENDVYAFMSRLL